MEKKTYRITFMADLTEDDVRAMQKCFYDAMQEAMEIGPCWELKLEEVKFEGEPNPDNCEVPGKYQPSLDELLMIPMDHIQKVKDCFAACTSKEDVFKVIRLAPNMFGRLDVDFDDESAGFTIVNTYTDEENDFQEEHYWFDYPGAWEYEDNCDDPDVDEELLAEYKKEGED